jgi:exoribonuclease II
MSNIVFVKSGEEIKQAVSHRREQLEVRLEARNKELDEFLKDTEKVRSYLIRHSEMTRLYHGERGYALYPKEDISSEESERIDQLCRRIYQIEQELHRLSLITTHLRDEDRFSLNFNDLVGYGFEIGLEKAAV